MVPFILVRAKHAFLFPALVALALSVPSLVRGDEVHFADTTDTVVGTTTGSRASIDTALFGLLRICGLVPLGNTNVEGCAATITAPTGASLTSGNHVYLASENGVLSDALAVFVDPPVSGKVHVQFLSDTVVLGAEPGLPLSCADLAAVADVASCSSVGESASVSLMWSNGTTDTVSFDSDSEGVVPEPASLVLLGSGLLAIASFVKKRI
jgi:hypothetical protein